MKGRLVALLALAAAVLLVLLPGRATPESVLPQLNDVAATAAEHWPGPRPEHFDPDGQDFSVVDDTGRLLVHRGAPIGDQREAARRHAVTADVVMDGRRVGQVFVVDPAVPAATAQRERVRWWALAGVGLAAAVAAAVVASVQWRILRPFRRLQRFAVGVAGGDLDSPLRMDRDNVFGAFTESFDILRTELAAARRAEAAQRQSKADLVAQLSHDIRTPVASALATAELLAATETEPDRRARLDVIAAQARQVDDLATDLFAANRDDLAALPVTPQDLTVDDLQPMFTGAVLPAGISCRIEPSLLRADPRRLQQVIDNVLVNSAKYAGTPVQVTGDVEGRHLVLRVRDRGPGVPDAEVEAILGKGVRGSNTGTVPGSGLGLFTAAYLMERMGGALACANLPDGFEVRIDVPLA